VDDLIDSLCGKSDAEIRAQLSKLEKRLHEVIVSKLRERDLRTIKGSSSSCVCAVWVVSLVTSTPLIVSKRESPLQSPKTPKGAINRIIIRARE
jgi:hypothetical protein